MGYLLLAVEIILRKSSDLVHDAHGFSHDVLDMALE